MAAVSESGPVLGRREALQYFLRVEAVVDGDELTGDPERRRLFVANVLRETRPNAYRMACDMHCSRVMEKLVRLCSPAQAARLLRVLRPDYERLVTQRCGSHVAQALAALAAKHCAAEDEPDADERQRAAAAVHGPSTAGAEGEAGEEDEGEEHDGGEGQNNAYARDAAEDDDDDDEAEAEDDAEDEVDTDGGRGAGGRRALAACTLEAAAFLRENIADAVSDVYASHVLRTMLLVLAGLPPDQAPRARASQDYHNTFLAKRGGRGAGRGGRGGAGGRGGGRIGAAGSGDVLAPVRAKPVPPAFRRELRALVAATMAAFSPEWVTDALANPVLQVLLRVAEHAGEGVQDALARRVMAVGDAPVLDEEEEGEGEGGDVQRVAVVTPAAAAAAALAVPHAKPRHDNNNNDDDDDDDDSSDSGAESDSSSNSDSSAVSAPPNPAVPDAAVAAALPSAPADSRMLQRLLRDRTASHLLETCIAVSDSRLIHDIYTKGLRGRLPAACQHPVANFVVQRLLQHAPEAIVAMMVEEVDDYVEDILAADKANVVVALVEATARVGARQPQLRILRAVLRAFHLPDDSEGLSTPAMLPLGAGCLLAMLTADMYRSQAAAAAAVGSGGAAGEQGESVTATPFTADQRFTAQGASLLQATLRCDNELSRTLSRSLLQQGLVGMACHPYGSRALEFFFKAKSVPVKQKRKAGSLLEPDLDRVATDKFGSHVLDALWAASDIAGKKQLATRLLETGDALTASPYGRIIARNCRLEDFKRKNKEW